MNVTFQQEEIYKWDSGSDVNIEDKRDSGVSVLTLHHLQGVFISLGIAWLATVVVFILELYISRYWMIDNPNITFQLQDDVLKWFSDSNHVVWLYCKMFCILERCTFRWYCWFLALLAVIKFTPLCHFVSHVDFY